MIDRTQAGKRVQLVQTNDPYTKLAPGAQGTFRHIDKGERETTVSIAWDDGSSLLLIPGEGDQFIFIAEQQAPPVPVGVDLAARRLVSDYHEHREGRYGRTDHVGNTGSAATYRYHRQDIEIVADYLYKAGPYPTGLLADAIERLREEPADPTQGRLGDIHEPDYSAYFDDLAIVANQALPADDPLLVEVGQ